MKTSTQLANQIFDALYDEDDLQELKQKKVIAQELGYELSVKAIIDVELACVNDMAEELERLRSDRVSAVAQMSKSWKHNNEAQTDLLTRYVEMAESQFKEMERLRSLLDEILDCVDKTEWNASCDEAQKLLGSTK